MRVLLPHRQEKNTSQSTSQAQGNNPQKSQTNQNNNQDRCASSEQCDSGKASSRSSEAVTVKEQPQQKIASEFCSSTSSSGSFSSGVESRKRKQADMVLLRKGTAKEVSEKKQSMVRIGAAHSTSTWVEENSAASAHEDKPENKQDRERPFSEALKRGGLEVVEQEGDGNCLFRAVSLQVYGDSMMHGEVRRRCLDFMAKDEAHFSSFVTGEPFRDYIRRKRIDGVHGNNPEIQAISELFNRPVEVFDAEISAEKPLNIFHAEYKTADKPIRLSYHDGNHYNAVIDPLCPTAGLGLGLPGLDPGLADRLQMEKAVEESHRTQLQQAMQESNDHNSINHMYKQKALLLSDVEATEFQIDQAVLASSIETCNTNTKPSSRTQLQLPNPQPPSILPPASSHAVSPAAATSYSSIQPIDYPDTVQELVMNGFELQKVIRAYDLVGDNFDDLLSFLLSSC